MARIKPNSYKSDKHEFVSLTKTAEYSKQNDRNGTLMQERG